MIARWWYRLTRDHEGDHYIWWHMVDHSRLHEEKHFSRSWYLHLWDQAFNFHYSWMAHLTLLSVVFSTTDDDDISMSVGLHWPYFSLGIKRARWIKWLPGVKWTGKWGSGEREIRLAFSHGSFRWNLWAYPNESRQRWNEGWFNFPDLFFGREKYHKEPVAPPIWCKIEMPEGDYVAQVDMFRATRTRKRFVGPKISFYADVTPDISIPVPGKGENSWDMDQDGIAVHSCRAATVLEAVASIRQSALDTRRRYGGENWRPEGAN